MNLAAVLAPHDPNAVALIHQGDRTTYGRLRDDAALLRAKLLGLGLERGDRVAIVCGINPCFVTGFLATIGAGLVAVPLNPLSPTPELVHELQVVRPRVVLVGATGARAVAGIDRSEVPSIEHVVVEAGVDLEGSVAIDDLPAVEPAPVVDVDAGELALLLFTSGTAGAPKAAMLTHGNLLSNLEQVDAHPLEMIRPVDVVLGVIPLFHIQGLNAVLMGTLRKGATLALMERFDAHTVLELIGNEQVTRVSGPPTMWAAFAALPEAPEEVLSSIRLAISGAAPLSLAVASQIEDRYGLRVLEGYGLTEAAPVVTLAVADTPFGSIGRPVPGVEVRLIDAEGDDVLIGDPGEVWVRGPNVFSGYWEEPEATARVLTDDGWLRTGDIAVVDERGELRIIDRAKDMILVSGFNVYPAEVETVLADHPAVRAAAVAGISDPHHGEAVKAFVVAAEGRSVEPDQLIEFCRTRLAHYKCPVAVAVVAELPMTPTGKIMRRSLG